MILYVEYLLNFCLWWRVTTDSEAANTISLTHARTQGKQKSAGKSSVVSGQPSHGRNGFSGVHQLAVRLWDDWRHPCSRREFPGHGFLLLVARSGHGRVLRCQVIARFFSFSHPSVKMLFWALILFPLGYLVISSSVKFTVSSWFLMCWGFCVRGSSVALKESQRKEVASI